MRVAVAALCLLALAFAAERAEPGPDHAVFAQGTMFPTVPPSPPVPTLPPDVPTPSLYTPTATTSPSPTITPSPTVTPTPSPTPSPTPAAVLHLPRAYQRLGEEPSRVEQPEPMAAAPFVHRRRAP